jgi:hypothetical protein
MTIPLWLIYSTCIVFVLLVGAVSWLAGLLWQRLADVPPDPYRALDVNDWNRDAHVERVLREAAAKDAPTTKRATPRPGSVDKGTS